MSTEQTLDFWRAIAIALAIMLGLCFMNTHLPEHDPGDDGAPERG